MALKAFLYYLVLIAIILTTCQATTRTVGCADCDFKTIQDAIDASKKGDEIKVYSGTYPEDIELKTDGIILRGVNTGGSKPVITNDIYDGYIPIKMSCKCYDLLNNCAVIITANNITLEGFAINWTHDWGNIYNYGIVAKTNNSIIANNNISNLNQSGIVLCSSSGNEILCNELTNNNMNGIHLICSRGNHIAGNRIAGSNYGIFVDPDSIYNSIYCNCLKDPSGQFNAYDPGTNNEWDNGAIGNYYSNFEPQCNNDANDQGICNSAYPIEPGTNIDEYPISSESNFTKLRTKLHICSINGTENGACHIELKAKADPGKAKVGDTVNYIYNITNTGSKEIYIFNLTDDINRSLLKDKILEPSESIGAKSSYRVNESDLPGPLSNTVSVMWQPCSGGPKIESKNVLVDLANRTDLMLIKVPDPYEAKLGDRITYHYELKNTGEVNITGIVMRDNKTGAVDLNRTDLSLSQTANGTSYYEIIINTQDSSWHVNNSVTASGKSPWGTEVKAIANASVKILNPKIRLTKTPSPNNVSIGETVNYVITVENIGNVNITGIVLKDHKLNLTQKIGDLVPGETSQPIIAKYVVNYLDLPGPLNNTARAEGSDPTGTAVNDSASALVNITAPINISLSKVPSQSLAYIGDVVGYNYTITNTGDVRLTNITLVDSVTNKTTKMMEHDLITPNRTELNPGEVANAISSYLITESDFPGPVINTANVTGEDIIGRRANDSDSASVSLIQSKINLTKTANRRMARIGDIITYTYVIKNTGQANIMDLTLEDSNTQPGNLSKTSLMPGEAVETNSTYTIKDSDGLRSVVNVATARARTNWSREINDFDLAEVLIINPNITLTKEPNRSSAWINDTVIYNYTINNTGDVRLTNITLVDNRTNMITPDKTELNPKETTYARSSYLVTESDFPGPLVNNAAAEGLDPTGRAVNDSDSASVNITAPINISLSKVPSQPLAYIGDVVVYNYTITNTGDVRLTNITLVDSVTNKTTKIMEHDLIKPNRTELDPGEIASATSSYLVNISDLPGPVINTANVTGWDFIGRRANDSASASVPLLQPKINLTKTADRRMARIGDVITYTYVIKNTGQANIMDLTIEDSNTQPERLSKTSLVPGEAVETYSTYQVNDSDWPGSVINTASVRAKTNWSRDVNDSDSAKVLTIRPNLTLTKEASPSSAWVNDTITYSYTIRNTGDIGIANLSLVDDRIGKINLTRTSLLPNQTSQARSSYVIKRSDLPGPLNNTATARGFDPTGRVVGDTANATVILENRSISLDKEANSAYTFIGGVITYTYIVTNIGTVPIANLTLNDNKIGDISINKTILLPGSSTQVTSVYKPKESDLPGPINNSATVRGESPWGAEVNDTANASVKIIDPKLILIKEPNSNIAYIGDNVTYTITVKNIGNVNVTDIELKDGKLNLNRTIGKLAPGETSQPIDANYTISDSDLPGPIINIADAIGKDPYGIEVKANNTTSVDILNPKLNLTKKPNPDKVCNVGDTIIYTLIVKNIGNVNLTGIELKDGKLNLSKNISGLMPGENAIITLNYTVNELDMQLGSIVNIANATGKDPAGRDVGTNATAVTSVPHCSNPIVITKTPSVNVADVGQTITYTYKVTNNDQLDVSDLILKDSSSPENILLSKTTLQPGDTAIGTLTYTVQIKDAPGPLVNTATVTCMSHWNEKFTASASASVDINTADIQIIKNCSSRSITACDQINYSIAVANNGPSTARDVMVKDLIPNGTSFASSIPGTYNRDSGMWSLGDLAPGERVMLYLIVNASSWGTVNNTAEVYSGTFDPKPENNKSTATIEVEKCQADIGINKSSSPKSVSPGDTITYTIKVENFGPVTAKCTQVEDLIPNGTTFSSGSASMGTYDRRTGIWNVGDLLPSASADLKLMVKAESTGNITNLAKAYSSAFDPYLGNNVAEAITRVIPPPRCGTINVLVDRTVYHRGDSVRYNISVTNAQDTKRRMAISYGYIDSSPQTHIIETQMPDIIPNDTYTLSADFKLLDDFYSGKYVFFATAVDIDDPECSISDATQFLVTEIET